MSIIEASDTEPKKDLLSLGFCGPQHQCRVDCAHYGRVEQEDGQVLGMCVLHEMTHLHSVEGLLRQIVQLLKEKK